MEKIEKIKSFKGLRIWQKGIEIVKEIYHLIHKFPKEEAYGLTSQMKRAALSIPPPIAEGFKRYHPKEYKQFLHTALRSAAELETQLVISKELGFINQAELDYISERLDHVSKMLTSLSNKLF